MIHQVLANDRFWMAQPDCCGAALRGVARRPCGGVLTLARFLGIALEQSEAVRIAESYSQEANRARAEALRDRLQQSGVDLESAANYQICDPTTLLHWNHLRPGGGGSWITKAEPRQRVVLKRLCRRWLAARGYELEPVPLPRSRVRVARPGEDRGRPDGRPGQYPGPERLAEVPAPLPDDQATCWVSRRRPMSGRPHGQIRFPRHQPAAHPSFRPFRPPIAHRGLANRNPRVLTRFCDECGYWSADRATTQGLRGYSSLSLLANSSARPSCLSWRNSAAIWCSARGCSSLSLL